MQSKPKFKINQIVEFSTPYKQDGVEYRKGVVKNIELFLGMYLYNVKIIEPRLVTFGNDFPQFNENLLREKRKPKIDRILAYLK